MSKSSLFDKSDRGVTHLIATDKDVQRQVKNAKAFRSHLWDNRKITNRGSVSGMGQEIGETMHTAQIPSKVFHLWLNTYGPVMLKDKEFMGKLVRRYQGAFGTGGSSAR